MGQFISNIDMIRERTAATVLVVHHFGKDESRGMRGHNSLRAAADTVIEVSDLTHGRVYVVEKQKDGKTGGTHGFRLEQHDLGRDDDGDQIAACVVVPCDSSMDIKKPNKKLPAGAKAALGSLVDCIARHGIVAPASAHIPSGAKGVGLSSWREHLMSAQIINREGSYREEFKRLRVTLQDHGKIGVWEEFVWLVT
jgi:hypothetical protein